MPETRDGATNVHPGQVQPQMNQKQKEGMKTLGATVTGAAAGAAGVITVPLLAAGVVVTAPAVFMGATVGGIAAGVAWISSL